ncbi:lipopolysaccharide biosynthesis protein [Curtobacterium oceanosedimentum]|uniref:lipopolysaccharide biosynthesis protein n=1 Tax=Curtobacterium oceanosedimentum TaxID=465820 RepID=UPI001CE11F33|nr:polysaccharide biosynthesis C-terminal domain-containing protein [Curtobacterium oceanosedimentum]MCA5924723.1 polysaccharide biosynthesis C-terminal domain-containing protein [Curtobacterium oceanosedimentum]
MNGSPSMGERPMAHQAVLLAGATGLSQVLVAVLYLFAARGVGPEAFGSVVSAIALGTAAAGFIDFGTNNHWTRELARQAIGRDAFAARLFSKIAITVALGVIWTVVLGVAAPASHLWLAGPVAAALVANQAYQVPLRSAARGDLVALVILSDRASAAVFFFALLAVQVPSTVALWVALAAGSVLASAIAGVLGPDRLGRVRLRLVNPWVGARYFGITVVATSAQSLDLALLSGVSGSAASGVYGAVSRWTQPMSLLAAAFSSALAPYAARSPDLRAAWSELRRALWMPVAAIGLAVAVFFAAPLVVDVLLGDDYAGSAGVLRLLALVVIPSIICQPLVVILQAFGRDRYVALIMVIAAIAQLVLVLVLGHASGALGAAQAALVSQLLILVALILGVLHFRNSSSKAGRP